MDEFLPYWFEMGREAFSTKLKGDILIGRRLSPTDRVAPPPKGAFSTPAKGASSAVLVPPDILDMSVVDLSKAFEVQRRFEVGSAPDCLLRLDHPTVSPRHATLELEGHNVRWISDTGSQHGTFINRQELAPRIKVMVNLNDGIHFGAYRLSLRDYSWIGQQLATRLRRPREDEGFTRLVLRYLDGRIVKRVARNYQLSGDRLYIENFLTGKGETFPVLNIKAVFFVKNLLGNPHRPDKQGFVQESCGENMFVEFLDGECMWGAVQSYNPNAIGFYIKPCDDEGNNLQAYIDRRATKYILNG
jgi:hypothetical protein